jgi:cytochrome c oxidase assembly factor 5
VRGQMLGFGGCGACSSRNLYLSRKRRNCGASGGRGSIRGCAEALHEELEPQAGAFAKLDIPIARPHQICAQQTPSKLVSFANSAAGVTKMPSSCKDLSKPPIIPSFSCSRHPGRTHLAPASRINAQTANLPPPTGAALAQCLLSSPCMTEQGHSASDCLRSPLVETLPERCQQLKRGFGECRRGMLDMRKRFRGNQPISARMLAQTDDAAFAPEASLDGTGKEEEKGYQLYAGRSAFGERERGETDGNGVKRDWREVENEKYRAEQKALEAQSRKDAGA